MSKTGDWFPVGEKDVWFERTFFSSTNPVFGYLMGFEDANPAYGARTEMAFNDQVGGGFCFSANINHDAPSVYAADGRPCGHPSDGRSF